MSGFLSLVLWARWVVWWVSYSRSRGGALCLSLVRLVSVNEDPLFQEHHSFSFKNNSFFFFLSHASLSLIGWRDISHPQSVSVCVWIAPLSFSPMYM